MVKVRVADMTPGAGKDVLAGCPAGMLVVTPLELTGRNVTVGAICG
jgi:hypothetical protein